MTTDIFIDVLKTWWPVALAPLTGWAGVRAAKRQQARDDFKEAIESWKELGTTVRADLESTKLELREAHEKITVLTEKERECQRQWSECRLRLRDLEAKCAVLDDRTTRNSAKLDESA